MAVCRVDSAFAHFRIDIGTMSVWFVHGNGTMGNCTIGQIALGCFVVRIAVSGFKAASSKGKRNKRIVVEYTHMRREGLDAKQCELDRRT